MWFSHIKRPISPSVNKLSTIWLSFDFDPGYYTISSAQSFFMVGAYLDLLRKFGNGTSCHTHSTTNDTGQAFADICGRTITPGPLKTGGQSWNDMYGDLVVNSHQSTIESHHGIESHPRHKGRASKTRNHTKDLSLHDWIRDFGILLKEQ